MNKKIIYNTVLIITCLVVFFGVITAFLISFDSIYAWFATNTSTRAGASDISVRGDFDIGLSYRTSEEMDWQNSDSVNLSLSGLYPGYSKTLQVRMKSGERDPLTLTLALDSPDNAGSGNEIPLSNGDETEKYYLGSQIRISEITAAGAVTADKPGEGKYLVETTNNGGGDGQATAVSEPVGKIPLLTLVNGFTLNSAEEVTFSFTFEFVENGTNQNVYKAFSEEGNAEKCTRLFCVFGS